MEANLNKVINMRITKTIENLKKNNMNAFFVPSKVEALALLKSMLVKGETISVGGSVSLDEIDAFSVIRNTDYNFLDRYDKNLTNEQRFEVLRKGLLADTFITGTNAITENGCLYNVDGTGNRVAALVFGPKRVIVIAGYNKIVPDLASAVVRVKKTACPANTVRLDIDSFCEKNGHCIKDYCDNRDLMTIPAGSCENCICSTSVVTASQRLKNRINVVIVGEELGY